MTGTDIAAQTRLALKGALLGAFGVIAFAFGPDVSALTSHPDQPPLPSPSAAEANWRSLSRAAFATEMTVSPDGGAGDAQSLATALDIAPLGAVIRLAPGVYTGPFQVDRPVTLTGAGAPGEVIIQAAGADSLRWLAAGGRIANLTVASLNPAEEARAPHGAIDVAVGAVVIEDVHVLSQAGPAVHVRDGARATLRRLSAAEGGATALSVYRGGRAEVRDPVVGGHRGAAFEVFSEGRLTLSGGIVSGGGGGVFAIEDSEIDLRDTLFNGIEGAAVAVSSGSVARLRGVTVSEPRDAGFLVGSSSMLAAIDCRIRGSRLAGVEARDGARVALRRCVIENADQGGVLARAKATLRIERSVVRGSRLAGVEVRNGATATVEHSMIEAGGASGVYVHGDASATLTDNEIRDNARAGVEVANGGHARLGENALEANEHEAVLVRDGGRTESAVAGAEGGAETVAADAAPVAASPDEPN